MRCSVRHVMASVQCISPSLIERVSHGRSGRSTRERHKDSFRERLPIRSSGAPCALNAPMGKALQGKDPTFCVHPERARPKTPPVFRAAGECVRGSLAVGAFTGGDAACLHPGTLRGQRSPCA
jgi:hypothetical protein